MITDFTTEWGETSVEPSRISGERRNDRRYSLQLDLKWKLIRRRRLLDTGSGHTIDLSSGGILLETGRHLPEGLDVELSIAWPVLLHNQKPLQLAVCGRIVRSQGGMIAIQMLQHEFRTTGVAVEQRVAMAARAPLARTGLFAVISGTGKIQ